MSRERVFDRLEAFASFNGLTKTAGRKKTPMVDRKALQKQLEAARSQFVSSREQYEQANQQLAEMQKRVDAFQTQMNEARQNVLTLSERLQTMDLTGANAYRDRNSVTTYYIGGKEHAVERGESPLDIRTIPYSDFKRKQKELEEASLAEETEDDSKEQDPDLLFASDIFSQEINNI